MSGSGEGLTVFGGGQGGEEGGGGDGPGFGSGEAFGFIAHALAEHFGGDDAWVQGDGSEAGREFLGEGLSEAFDGPLAGAVGCDFGRGGAAPAGGEINDDTLTVGEHGGKGMADEVGGAVDVDGGEMVKFFGGNFPKWGGGVDGGGVVDEEVGCSGGVEGVFTKLCDVVIAGNIAGDEVGGGEFFFEVSEGNFIAPAADDGVSAF